MQHERKTIHFGNVPKSLSASSWTADEADEEKISEVSKMQTNDILCSDTSVYLLQDFIGEGCFGNVIKCVNLVTSQNMALKINKTGESTAIKREVMMLEKVRRLDPVKNNVAQFFETFEHRGHTCLVFEILDRSLLQLFIDRHCKPLALSEIRPIAQQLLLAFDALKSIGVVHSDLKADNIMLTDHAREPFRVKLIDFGVSFSTSENPHGCIIQPQGYRAPEVSLGLPISEAVDMWGLGCVLAWLYLASHLFSINCEYQSMRGIVEILGQPADHLLNAGYFSRKYFNMNLQWDNPRWSLKTPEKYKLDIGINPQHWERSLRSLNDLITPDGDMLESVELEDRIAFVSFLKCLLHTDSEKRITPETALKHPFVTMSHLMDEVDIVHGRGRSYMDDSFEEILVCQMDDSQDELPDNESDRETKSESPSARPCSCSNIKVVLCSNEEAAAAAVVVDATGSANEGPPVKVKQSRLKRIRKFAVRMLQRVFGKKTC